MSSKGSKGGFSKKQKQVLDKDTVFDQFAKPCMQQRFTDFAKKLNQVDNSEFNYESDSSIATTAITETSEQRKRKPDGELSEVTNY